MKQVNKSTKHISTSFFIFFLLVAALPLSAQRLPDILQGAEAQSRVPQSELVRMDARRQTPSFVKFQEMAAPDFKDFTAIVQMTYKVGADYQLALLRSEKDQLGYQHYRYQQTYKGLPVEGNVFLAHVKDGKLVSMNGTFSNKIAVATQPAMTEKACLTGALRSIKADKYMWELLEEQPALRTHDAYKDFADKPKGQLVIIDKNLGTERAPDYRLVYKFDIYAYQPHQRVAIFVDAKTGEIVQQFNKIHEDAVGDEPATAETTYSGNRSMTTDNTGTGPTPYRLFEAGRNISTKNLTGNAEYTDNDNAWTAAEMGNAKYAMDAHWGTEKTYDYFLNTFGRNSFDGNGALIRSFLNNNGNGNNNAFWNGSTMNYGSAGQSGVTPLTCLDVVGHEITHAVTQYSAGLNYSYQSGALNESFSDIFGTAIEFYAKPPSGTGNWTLGEDANFIIRSMSNPNAYNQPDTYLGTHWWTAAGDNGGVHFNSGVQNFWFYLLTVGGTGTNDIGNAYNVTSIGMADAAAIAYRSLTVYLTPSSNYADARFYSIIAAKDLFGGCPVSQQVISTTNAWHAVGVGAVYTPEALTMNFSTPDPTLYCSGPRTIHFIASQTTGLADPATVSWNFGDGGTATGFSVTHTYATTGSFHVTLNASDCAGTPISVVKNNFIVIDNTNPCVLNMPTSGNHSETTCTGTLYDDGGMGNYHANINSSFTIHSATSEKVTLKFLSFNFELDFDYLKIYDGPDTSAPLIGSYTGTALPNGGFVQSSGTSITIQQLIDQGVEEAGFQLLWVSEPDGDGVAGINCGGTDCDNNDPNVSVNCGNCVDADLDGYYAGCDNYITVLGPDCNDNPANGGADIYPGATEVCNAIDDNCNGQTDEGFAQDYYFDGDSDGYGAGVLVHTCQPAMGYILQNGDCDDGNDAVNPGETEICNNVDDNCTGGIDEGITQNYYFDGDNDGYGAGAAVLTCSPGPGYILQNGDCNDADEDINPGVTEVCNGSDDNCDGIVDFPPVATYTSTNVPVVISTTGTPTVTSTINLSGFTANIVSLTVKDLIIHHTYIGDLKATLTSPGNVSIVLFDRPGYSGTGFGCSQNHILATFDDAAASTAESTCATSGNPTPPPYAINGTFRPENPFAPLIGTSPNGIWTLTVQDFEGGDGGSIQGWSLEITMPNNTTTYYADTDGDSYGDPASSMAFGCTPGAGYVLDNTDCDDNATAIHPNATEVCNGVDDNCVGGIDEGNVCCPAGNILYVNDDATGLNNGASWTDAFTSLQSALASTCPGITQIWVAAGTYKPTSTTTRTISFVLENNLAIYGGFVGNEPSNYNLALRNFSMNTSTLSGEINATGTGDNSYSVVKGSGTNNTAILDGFTITGGNANAAVIPGSHTNPEHSGGGLYNNAGSPTVRNCTFSANSALMYGGGMFNFSASPIVTNCIFSGNSSTGNTSHACGGGGMHNMQSSPVVTNCSFISNTAARWGGGMRNNQGYFSVTPIVTNCTFYGNSAGEGGGMITDSASVTVKNSIFWGNSNNITFSPPGTRTITNSIVQGGCPAFATSCTNVLNLDPLFENAAGGNLRLTACSPALDAGSDGDNATTTDLDGNARKFEAYAGGSMIDLGAYEFQSAGATESVVTVSVSPASTLEDGADNLVYTFERNCATTALTVNFNVSGTAVFSTDYGQTGAASFSATNGTVSFAAGVSTATVTIDPAVDNTVEMDETVILTLTAGTGYTAGIANAATGTITNDDAATVSISADVSQSEATSSQQFTLSLSNPVDVLVAVNFSTADGTATTADNDYNGVVNQTVFFGPGSTIPLTVYVTVNNDNTVEGDETFGVSIGNLSASGRNVSLGTSSRTGTITNDDAATVSISADVSQSEATSPQQFTLSLSNPVDVLVAVNFSTADGTATLADNDYNGVVNQTVVFGPGSTIPLTVYVTVNNDNTVEGDETFGVSIGNLFASGRNVSLGTSSRTGTITNDDAATVSIAANVSQPEATTPQAFSVTLSNPVDVAVTVNFNTANGTATTADNDYNSVVNQTVTFAAGTTTAQTVNVTITNDSKVEADETYTATIGTLGASDRNVTLGTSSRTGTIQNDDSSTLTLSGGGSANEGNTGTNTRTFTATLSNAVQDGFSVAFTTNNGTATTADNDYVDSDGTLTFLGNTNEPQTIMVMVNGDFKVEADETFTVALGAITGTAFGGSISTIGTPQTGTILNDETDFGDAPDTYATLSASNGARHNASLALRLGATVDGEADGQPNGTASGEGADDDGVSLPASIIAATTASVTVNASATGKLDAWVDFNGDGDFADVGEQVFTNEAVVAGNNLLTFMPPNSVFQGTSFARFRLSTVGGLSFDGLANDGEVEDYTVMLINTQFSINDPSVMEGNGGTTNLAFVISRSSNASVCSVNYAITGGSATTADADYQILSVGTASFTADGDFSQTINVVVNGDTKVELNETVEMTLSTPVSGNILDGSGTGTIQNDDAATITIGSPSITEGDAGTANLTFIISMSNPSDANVIFNFGTNDGAATLANSDYQNTNGSHTLTPGQTSKEVNVPIVGDCTIESSENFTVRLSSLSNNGRAVTLSGGGATLDGTGTITNDDALPVLTCAANFSQNTDAGVCNANVAIPLPSTSSICGSSTLEFRHRTVDAANVPTGAFSAYIPAVSNTQNFAKGKHEIEWRVTDGSGNMSCSLFLTVLDNENPVAVCKTTILFLNAAGQINLAATQVDNGSSDNCNFVLAVSPNNFTCANVGPNTVTLTATDPDGNSNSCQAVVTVSDNMPPTALCKNATIYLDANGQASVTATQVNNNSTDNCGILSIGVSPNAFTCSNLGANIVTLTVIDLSENASTCTATVTVVDNLPPTVICQNLSIQLDGNANASILPADVYNAAASSDNCGNINLVSVSPGQFGCSKIGQNTVTLTVNDGHGNTATCTAIVTVQPFFTNIVVQVTPEDCGMGNGSIVVTQATPSGTGQIGYSINGGATFQLNNTFEDLPAGTYSLVIQSFGGSGCTSDPIPTVVTSVGNPQTWYKDTDGDGYSNGLTLVQCTSPGTGWYLASQLTATTGDCNDANAAIHPGATEICDGLDNDCSGNPEAAANTWTGAGDGANWSDAPNWSDGIVPLACQNVVIPSGNVSVPAGFNAVGNTLEVATGAVLTVEPTGTVEIQN